MKRQSRPLYLFLFLIAVSVTLVACDSNGDEDTELVVDVTTTTTTTTVAPSDPVVQEIADAVTDDFQGVVGDNVVVDNTAGAIQQITSVSTTSSGSSTTTTATVAPLVNATTGQPTGQVAVVIQSGTQTTTTIVSMSSTDPSSLVGATQDPSGQSSTYPFDATFNLGAASTQKSDSGSLLWVSDLNALISAIPNLTSVVEINGVSWAQALADAIAAGKSDAHVIAGIFTANLTTLFTTLKSGHDAARAECQGQVSAIIVVFYDVIIGGQVFPSSVSCNPLDPPYSTP